MSLDNKLVVLSSYLADDNKLNSLLPKKKQLKI